jgi:hypothetical protein
MFNLDFIHYNFSNLNYFINIYFLRMVLIDINFFIYLSSFIIYRLIKDAFKHQNYIFILFSDHIYVLILYFDLFCYQYFYYLND